MTTPNATAGNWRRAVLTPDRRADAGLKYNPEPPPRCEQCAVVLPMAGLCDECLRYASGYQVEDYQRPPVFHWRDGWFFVRAWNNGAESIRIEKRSGPSENATLIVEALVPRAEWESIVSFGLAASRPDGEARLAALTEERDGLRVALTTLETLYEERTEQYKALLQPVDGEARPQEGWQPIETAPKDGSTAYLVADGRRIEIARQWIVGDEHRGWFPRTSTYPIVPTHWMPLPASPGDGAAPPRGIE